MECGILTACNLRYLVYFAVQNVLENVARNNSDSWQKSMFCGKSGFECRHR